MILGSSLPLLAKPGQSKESLFPRVACPSPRPTPVTWGSYRDGPPLTANLLLF